MRNHKGEEILAFKMPVAGWKKCPVAGIDVPFGLNWSRAERLDVDLCSIQPMQPADDGAATVMLATQREAASY